MIGEFKFLTDNNEYFDSYDGPSWMFCNVEDFNQLEYNIMTDNYYGIRSFLNQFPNGYIVSVVSIVGPNGIEHTIHNDGQGWGFDITSDLITVQWVRFNG
jgi:hypothetical protein